MRIRRGRPGPSLRAYAGGLTAALAQQPIRCASWNDGPAKARIVAFVQAVTATGRQGLRRAGRPHRGVRQRRHAVVRAADVLPARLRHRPRQGDGAEAPGACEDSRPLRPPPTGDMKALVATGEKGLARAVIALTHAGTTTDEFAQIVRDWAKTAQHPTLKRPYTELTYAPMRELLDYLRANGFKTYIVSGGGIEFLRVDRRKSSTACRPSRWSGRASRRSTRCATASR